MTAYLQTGHMNLLNTPIITSGHDTFWADVSGLPEATTPLRLLILSTPFQSGSAEESTLYNLLAACKLNPMEYLTLSLQHDEAKAWHKLRELYQPQNVLLLGLSPAQLGITALFQFNRSNHFDGTIWIPTLPLMELNQRGDVKRDLWNNTLAPIFVPK